MILFPAAEHHHLFDALQTAMEVAMEECGELVACWVGGGSYYN